MIHLFFRSKDNCFFINHFIGPVEYDIKGFLEKNNNRELSVVAITTLDMLQASANSILMSIFSSNTPKPNDSSTLTLTQQVNLQMTNLLSYLKTTECHFIQCLRSNDSKSPFVLDSKLLNRQIKAFGLLDVVCLRKAGFACRMTKDSFIKSYRAIAPRLIPLFAKRKMDVLECCKLIFDNAMKQLNGSLSSSSFSIGKTRVFIKTRLDVIQLESLKAKCIVNLAVKIQSIYRMHFNRRRYLLVLETLREEERRLQKQLHLEKYSSTLIQKSFRRYHTIKSLYLLNKLLRLRHAIVKKCRDDILSYLHLIEDYTYTIIKSNRLSYLSKDLLKSYERVVKTSSLNLPKQLLIIPYHTNIIDQSFRFISPSFYRQVSNMSLYLILLSYILSNPCNS